MVGQQETPVIMLLASCMIMLQTGLVNCDSSINKTSWLNYIGPTVPESVPDNVDHVILHGVNLATLKKGQFSHVSWNRTVYLQIDATLGDFLASHVFLGLNSLKHLKLRGSNLTWLHVTSFRGLPSLMKLDLSDNYRLGFYDVLGVLGDEVELTLPSLTWLDLTKVQIFYSRPIEFINTERNGFEILSRRRIEYLDFSGCTIAPLNVNEFGKLCKHLKHLVVKNAKISNPIYRDTFTCESLRTLDIRDMFAISLINILDFTGYQIFLSLVVDSFLFPVHKVETILASNVFKADEIGQAIVTDLKLNLTKNPLSCRKLDLSRNNFRVFNASVYLHPHTSESVRDLDFSGNTLEYFSPQALGESTHLERLNFSQNNLNIMLQNYPSHFEALLVQLTKLKSLDLSHNQLMSLPIHMFKENNHLQYINLSDNFLTLVSFKFENLIHLRILDIHGNRIKVLHEDVFRQFASINNFQNLQNGNSTTSVPNILLYDNPFVCQCEEKYLKSLEWIEYSSFVSNETSISCTLNRESDRISQSVFQDTKEHCHRIKVQQICLILGVTLLTLTVISITGTILVCRILTKRNAVKQFIKKIKTGDKLKNLIFLSFCNEDGDYVLTNIYPKLKEEATRALDCQRNLVCCGELNFRPGMSVCLEVMRCIEESAVIIFVVSNTFCKKNWCKMEVDTANAQRKPVILLFLEKVKPEVMTPYIQKVFNQYTRASWVHDQDGGKPHPPWPVLISSVIELGSSFEAENQSSVDTENLNGGYIHDAVMKM